LIRLLRIISGTSNCCNRISWRTAININRHRVWRRRDSTLRAVH